MEQKPEPNQSSCYQNSSSNSSVSSVEELASGQWTKQEHFAFLRGLQVYGKNWNDISKLVGSRTESQVRSHAQKYLNKQQRRRTQIGKCEIDPQLIQVSSEVKLTRNKVKQALKMNSFEQGKRQSTLQFKQKSCQKIDHEIIVGDEQTHQKSETFKKKKIRKFCNKKVQFNFEKDVKAVKRQEKMGNEQNDKNEQINQKRVNTSQKSCQNSQDSFELVKIDNGILFPCWRSYFYIPDQVWRKMLFEMKQTTGQKQPDQNKQNIKGFQPYRQQ